MTQKRKKHNYTSELELKSLLIRIKNKKAEDENDTTEYLNTRINKYIGWFTKINAKKYKVPTKRNKLKAKLKERIVRDSEISKIDTKSYERFGQIILLMIKNILKKPQFSGYTYKDDFYSDSVYKILKYLHNFNHKLISERTGAPVNAFAYISQIIHNSILYIINTKKIENNRLKNQIGMEMVKHDLTIKRNDVQTSTYIPETTVVQETIIFKEIKTTLVDEVLKIVKRDDFNDIDEWFIKYPKSYKISFDEYNELKPLLNGTISITQIREPND